MNPFLFAKYTHMYEILSRFDNKLNFNNMHKGISDKAEDITLQLANSTHKNTIIDKKPNFILFAAADCINTL